MRQQARSWRSNFFIQMGEYLVDDHRILNAGDHFDGTAACTARFDVDIENPLQSLCPGHRCPAFGGRWVLRLVGHLGLFAFAPLCRRDQYTMLAVGCKHTVTNSSGMNLDSFSWPAKRAGIRDDTSSAGEVNPRFRHQGSQPGADKSAGEPICTTTGRPKGGAHGCAS